MPAKRKKNRSSNNRPDERDQLGAIATAGLTDDERTAALGGQGMTLNKLLRENPDWKSALAKGAAHVDALAMKRLFQLVSGDYEVTEDRFPLQDEAGNVCGTRKITRPGPSFQACKYWLDMRTGNGQSTPQSTWMKISGGGLADESKQQVISSILALIAPKHDPVIEDVEPETD